MSGLIQRSKLDRYSITSSEMQPHVETERAASVAVPSPIRKIRYGDIGRSEVRGKSVLEALRMLKAMVDTIA